MVAVREQGSRRQRWSQNSTSFVVFARSFSPVYEVRMYVQGLGTGRNVQLTVHCPVTSWLMMLS